MKSKMKKSKLSDIFNISYGTKLDMNKMTSNSQANIFFVSRSSKNNGVVGLVNKIKNVDALDKGLITVTLGGTYVLSAFLQEMPFYTGQNVAVLSPKVKLSREQKLFYCMCITRNRYRYSAFGREANRTLKDLMVPSLDIIPSWVNEIDLNKFDGAHERNINIANDFPTIKSTTTLDELFEIENGIAATGLKERKERFKDSIMYVRPASTHLRTKRSFIPLEQAPKNKTYPSGTLFVSTNGEGSHTYSYVSTEEFVPNSDVAVLIPKFKASIESKLFYSKCITANRFLFSYGRKPKGEKLRKIRLPNLDEDQVVKFINSLKYSKISIPEYSEDTKKI